jgi:hypothetical protein
VRRIVRSDGGKFDTVLGDEKFYSEIIYGRNHLGDLHVDEKI